MDEQEFTENDYISKLIPYYMIGVIIMFIGLMAIITGYPTIGLIVGGLGITVVALTLLIYFLSNNDYGKNSS